MLQISPSSNLSVFAVGSLEQEFYNVKGRSLQSNKEKLCFNGKIRIYIKKCSTDNP